MDLAGVFAQHALPVRLAILPEITPLPLAQVALARQRFVAVKQLPRALEVSLR
jgi:hypothetical protein